MRYLPVIFFIFGAAVSYGYFFLGTNIELSNIRGKVEVFAKFCEPQLLQSEIVKKDKNLK